MDPNQQKIKAAGEKAYYADQCANNAQMPQAIGMGTQGYYRPSPAEEAEKRAAYHFEEGSKAQQAAAFLRAHPEFGEFIQLIRQGVIGI